MADEPEKFVSRGKAGQQVRKVRDDGWTARKREIFLDDYAENGNAAAACQKAGMAEGAAYRLRRRDPDFARQYDDAHAVCKLRLEEMAIEYARTQGRMVPVEPGETPPVDLANFDAELALKILSHARPSTNGNASRVGARPRAASRAELIEALVKLLAMLKKRRAKARRAGK
jgi:hypothetical protein